MGEGAGEAKGALPPCDGGVLPPGSGALPPDSDDPFAALTECDDLSVASLFPGVPSASAIPPLQISSLHELYLAGKLKPSQLLSSILDVLESAECAQKNIFLSVADRANPAVEGTLGAKLSELDAALETTLSTVRGSDKPSHRAELLARYPLFGVPFVCKDNIDAKGFPTTAGLPGLAAAGSAATAGGSTAATALFPPKPASAPCVAQLEAAGAVCIGKSNLDQLATGLVGTRSPYGAPENSFVAGHISGGSSSGSAIATALGLCSFSLGTDTAGSGRVPASLNNLVGLKPTKTRVDSVKGVVPACQSLDCVSVFALSCDDCATVLGVMESAAARGAAARGGVEDGPDSKSGTAPFTFGVPTSVAWFYKSTSVTEQAKSLFEKAVRVLESLGGTRVDVDYEACGFKDAADLLYEGPWVAERLVAMENLAAERAKARGDSEKTADDGATAKKEHDANDEAPLPEAVLDCLPVISKIISRGRNFSAADCFRAQYKLAKIKVERTDPLFGKNGAAVSHSATPLDFLLTPTCTTAWSFADVEADPVGANTKNGYYTNYMNLLDMSGVAVPVGWLSLEKTFPLPFGVTFAAPAWADTRLLEIGAAFQRKTGLRAGRRGETLVGV